MQAIVAIGGGDLGGFGTLPIDRQIVRLTGMKRPRALFLPTANRDSQTDWEAFNAVYGKRLRCRTEVLRLVRCRPLRREIARRILSAHLIYVGWGYTLRMLRLWRRLGVDTLMQVPSMNHPVSRIRNNRSYRHERYHVLVR